MKPLSRVLLVLAVAGVAGLTLFGLAVTSTVAQRVDADATRITDLERRAAAASVDAVGQRCRCKPCPCCRPKAEPIPFNLRNGVLPHPYPGAGDVIPGSN